MAIRKGVLENKTYLYLYPTLRDYGEEFLRFLRGLDLIEVKLKDVNVQTKNHCFYLRYSVNTQGKKNMIQKFLEYLQDKEYFIKEYIYDNSSHIIVIQVPKGHNNAIIHFLKGEYSKMYSPQKLKKYFYNTSSNPVVMERFKRTRQVLRRDKKYVSVFVKKVNSQFETKVEEKYFKNAELDFPPSEKDETLNFKF